MEIKYIMTSNITYSENKYLKQLISNNIKYSFFDVTQALFDIGVNIHNLPYSLRVLAENILRKNSDNRKLEAFKQWLNNINNKKKQDHIEIDFFPARVLMQDFTGVPAIVDLAAMRDAVKKIGKDPLLINPLIPVDLVIDHSVQVDNFASSDAFSKNVEIEIFRNHDRYKFLKWGQNIFSNFRVVPPATGICHQINLEYLASVIFVEKYQNDYLIAYPDSLVGTDSHTTMCNALGVIGWGVGGIEAEGAMLGQALPMILPDVIAVKLKGRLKEPANATDLVLTITEILRKKTNVVGKFVEFCGEAVKYLSLADRATIANMAPEYGATCGFFAIDNETIKYLETTARKKQQIDLVEAYSKKQNLWSGDDQVENQILYSEVIEIDLEQIEPSLAGPKRPQDRVSLKNIAHEFKIALGNRGDEFDYSFKVNNKNFDLQNGHVLIAAITSCTNTSNPSVMVAAGLLAKKASDFGLKVKPWVKTSLAPGSKIVTSYLLEGGLSDYLNEMGFNLVGYGCTSCIGNSGPIDSDIEEIVKQNKLNCASVLSGNRNFEGRIHAILESNYLASPPLVVAYAIAGNIKHDLLNEPLGFSKEGRAIYLKDIWPTKQEIDNYINQFLSNKLFSSKYQNIFEGDKNWQDLKVEYKANYDWDENNLYIKNPPYFNNLENSNNREQKNNIKRARILAIFGDSVTTDHISPAGNIAINSDAGKYLLEKGLARADFNSYGARRGNHEVMMRGTFANLRIKNLIAKGELGSVTINFLTGKKESIYQAAMNYKKENIPLVIFAGKEYGTGSSRDWAAKGTSLLGIKAVIAESFERIHRSNLAGMGVLPIILDNKVTVESLNLDGREEISILINGEITPYQELDIIIKNKIGQERKVKAILQIFTNNEVEYIKYGSIMHKIVFES